MKRTHPILALASTAMLGASATPGHASIFDRDDRQYVSIAQGSPYSPVGLVTQGVIMRSFTTGFLVDDCHVLTSQMVLGYGQAPRGKRLAFQTAIGTPQHQSTKATVVAAGGLKRHQTAEERYVGRAQSWLLLRLDRCIGASLGHVTLKTGPFSPYEFRDLKSIGYPAHRSRKTGLTIDPSCRVVASRGPIWLNDCATVKGDGGDPIFRLSTADAKPHMEVYAMQAYASIRRQPIPLSPGYENQAVPMALIVPQIRRYLSQNSGGRLGERSVAAPMTSDAISHIGAGPGVHSDGHLLGTRLVTADTRAHSESRAK